MKSMQIIITIEGDPKVYRGKVLQELTKIAANKGKKDPRTL